MNKHDLDLRGVACPMNFVKTRLFLDKVPAGEPIESVTASMGAEGHAIEGPIQCPEGHYLLSIRKV
jgi:TusA-related sulfurtransferase